jgi:hypothetical protein
MRPFQVLNIIGFICIASSSYGPHSKANFFYFVCTGGFWITCVLLVLYLFHFVEKFYTVKWFLIVSTSFFGGIP